MNHPELVHGLELLPCAIRDGMLYIPHADGNWVSAAKLQPFSLKIIEYWRAEQVEASRSRAASEPGEVARLEEKLRTWFDLNASHEPSRVVLKEDIARLASMATSPASEAQAGALHPSWYALVPVKKRPSCCDRGRDLNGGVSEECCGNGNCSQDEEEARARASWLAAPQPASSPVAAEGAHEVTRIWNEHARKFGFDGVAGMLNAFRHGEATAPASSPVAVEGQKAALTHEQITKFGLGLEYVHSVLRWAACGYVHTPERIASLHTSYRIVDRIINATPTASMADAAEAVADERIFDLTLECEGRAVECTFTRQQIDALVDRLHEHGLIPGPRGESAGGVVEALSREQIDKLLTEHQALGWQCGAGPREFADIAGAVQRACATAWGLRIAEKGDVS